MMEVAKTTSSVRLDMRMRGGSARSVIATVLIITHTLNQSFSNLPAVPMMSGLFCLRP